MSSTRAVSRVGITLATLLVFLFASGSPTYAQSPWSVLNPNCTVVRTVQLRGVNIYEVPTITGLECVFTNLVTVILELAGVVLFVMFLIGGFRYLTSGGDPKAVEAAKGTLTHAIIGLVVLILAFVILQLIQVITGVNVTTFRIYKP